MPRGVDLEDLILQRELLRSGGYSAREELAHPPEGGIMGESSEVNLGNSVTVRKGGGWAALLQAKGDSAKGTVMTVNLQADNVQGGIAGGVGRRNPLRGRVRWGQGGGNYMAEVDLRFGAQLSILGSFIAVDAAIIGNDSAIIDSATVSGSISVGSRAALAEPTFSTDAIELPALAAAPLNTVDLQLPPFARSLRLFSPNRVPADFYAPGAVAVQFVGNGGDAVPFIYAAFTSAEALLALLNGDGLRWPEGARFVRITNVSATPFLFSACFPLSL